MLRQLRRHAREGLEILQRRAATLQVARAKPCRDELLEQRRLTTRGRPEGTQMARVEAVAGEPPARRGDLDVALAVVSSPPPRSAP